MFFALNHLLHFYRGQVPLDDYLRLLDEVPALEVRNGTMLPAHNELVERIVPRRWRPAAGALGDGRRQRRAHAAPGRPDVDRGARPHREEFLASVRARLGQAGGAHGDCARDRGDAYGVIGALRRQPARARARATIARWRRAACLAFAAVSLPVSVPAAASSPRAGKRASAARCGARRPRSTRARRCAPMPPGAAGGQA